MVGIFGVQYNFFPRKGIGIPDSGKFLLLECEDPEIFLVESGILGFGIRIPFKETGIQVTLTRNPESSIWIPESSSEIHTAWIPESKSVLDYLTWGEQ